MKREVLQINKAVYEPIADLVTYRAMPTPEMHMNALDPFIFLNHHGHQEYLPHNNGLPFGPHPHRGFETVTFILEGDLTHKDRSGATSIIGAGGVQWMTAGKGLIHAEVSSKEFMQQGGPLELLQLWVNLPAKMKMTEPAYKGLQAGEIPSIEIDGGKVKLHAVSGKWFDTDGPFQTLNNVSLCWMELNAIGEIQISIPENENILFYVIKGEVNVNGADVPMHHLATFKNEGSELDIRATHDSVILLGHALPFAEPFVAHGPFVMNTQDEIMQAFKDYHAGLLGDPENF